MKALFLPHPAQRPQDLPQEGWREVELPHQWSLEGLEAEVGWYRLELPGKGVLKLYADYLAEAWLEGAYLGRHEGYFFPWVLRLPEGGRLWLRVAAPKEAYGTQWPEFKRQIKGVFGHHDCRPGGSGPRGQERGTGGVWQAPLFLAGEGPFPLHLLALPHPTPTGWRLLLAVEVESERPLRAPLALVLRPANFQGEALRKEALLGLRPGRHVYPLLWDLPPMPLWEVYERGFPHLYALEASLAGRRVAAPVGFRTVAFSEDWLVLNGRRLFLRGTNLIPTQWLSTYTRARAEEDLRLVKEANLNAVRVHAHLAHPALYEAADREGVLVWQDFPLQWGYAEDEAFVLEALRQAPLMVKEYGSHPSIALWCAHNEPTHNRHTLTPLVAQRIRQADPTRPVKEASDFREHPYPGWYYGHLRDFLALPGAPLPSEFGAQALPRAELLKKIFGEKAWPPDFALWSYHNFQPHETFRVAGVRMGQSLEEFVENSQAYQARLIRFAVHAYRRAKGRVTGYFQFMLVEPWEGITWAVVDVERSPKRGYFALKEASAPVLLSLEPYRAPSGEDRVVLSPGDPPLMEAWLISDREEEVEAEVRLWIEGEAHLALPGLRVRLGPGEARRFFHLMEVWESPLAQQARWAQLGGMLKALPPGEYRLVGEAWEARRGERLSRDEFAFRLAPPLGL